MVKSLSTARLELATYTAVVQSTDMDTYKNLKRGKILRNCGADLACRCEAGLINPFLI